LRSSVDGVTGQALAGVRRLAVGKESSLKLMVST
jgi:hypothetical protein